MALTRKRALYAKIENTKRTAESVGKGDRVVMADFSPTPLEAETVERQLFRPYVGAAPVIIGSKTSVLNPTCELVGGGLVSGKSAPQKPQFHALLQACGMVESAIKVDGTASTSDNDRAGWRYTTGDPTKAKTCTIVTRVDGIQQIIAGCRGTFAISGEIGAIPTIAFTLTGLYQRPLSVAAAPSAGTFPADVAPQLFSSDNTAWDAGGQIDAINRCVYTFSADCGHTVETVDCVSGAVGKGLKVEITDRNTTGGVVADAKVDTTSAASVKDGDPWGVAGTGVGTAVAESVASKLPQGLIRHGTVPGAWWTIGGASVSIGAVTEEDRSGILAYSHPLVFSPTGDGNNELTLTFWGKFA